MIVAQFIDSFCLGGAQRMALQLCRAIPGSSILTHRYQETYLGREGKGHVPISFVPERDTGGFLTQLSFIKPDIFHMHWWEGIWPWHDIVYGQYEPDIRSQSGKPIKVVVTSHTSQRTFRGRCHAAVALSKKLAETRFQGPDRVELIYNGVDLSEWVAKDDYAIRDVPQALFVSRIDTDKSPRPFIKELRHTKTDVVFRIVGAGAMDETSYGGPMFQAWASDAYPSVRFPEKAQDDDDRFVFLGAISPYAIPDLMQKADIYIYASNFEAHCVSILEAMASGLPVITTSAVTMDETITHEHDGIICELKEIPEWTDRLLADQSLREKLGRNARKTCEERFDRRRVIRQYRELYESLLKED